MIEKWLFVLHKYVHFNASVRPTRSSLLLFQKRSKIKILRFDNRHPDRIDLSSDV